MKKPELKQLDFAATHLYSTDGGFKCVEKVYTIFVGDDRKEDVFKQTMIKYPNDVIINQKGELVTIAVSFRVSDKESGRRHIPIVKHFATWNAYKEFQNKMRGTLALFHAPKSKGVKVGNVVNSWFYANNTALIDEKFGEVGYPLVPPKSMGNPEKYVK